MCLIKFISRKNSFNESHSSNLRKQNKKFLIELILINFTLILYSLINFVIR